LSRWLKATSRCRRSCGSVAPLGFWWCRHRIEQGWALAGERLLERVDIQSVAVGVDRAHGQVVVGEDVPVLRR
jgi:hypothetical protein